MLPFIIFVILTVAAVLFLMLAKQIRDAAVENTTRKYRMRGAGFADLLNYAAEIDADGIVVGKNGSLMAAWSYRGSDNAAQSPNQIEADMALINQALARLGSGWMLHVDAVRHAVPGYPAPGLSAFPDPVSRAIDEERRQKFKSLGTMFDSEFVLTVTWYPPLLLERKFAEMMIDDSTPAKTKTEQTAALVNQFKKELANLESNLSTVLQMHRLKPDKIANEDGSITTFDRFLEWLQFCITGDRNPVVLPKASMPLDRVLGGREFWKGTTPMIGKKNIRIVAIDGFPLESTPGILTVLSQMSCEYRWSSRFIFLDPHEAVAHYNKYRKKWRQKVHGFFDQVFNNARGAVNQDALSMVQDAEDAIGEIESGFVAAGYYTSVVVLMDEDIEKLENQAREIAKQINRLGFSARIEENNTVEAYFGSLPGHGVENIRRPLINSLNLADLLPTSSIWTGSPVATCPKYPSNAPALMRCVTTGATPFWLNLHESDVGHTSIFGPTGSGKSTLLAMMAAQFRRYPGMSVFCFDKGMSMFALTKAVGGAHFRISGDNKELSFCPLQYLESPTDRIWAMEWIESILQLNNITITPDVRKLVANAIDSMRRTGGHTFTDLYSQIQNSELRAALEPYTARSERGFLFDAESDNLALSRFVTFEIEDLMAMQPAFALPVLLYLFRRIERSLTGQPAVILLDEAWLMLQHPVFREKLREWFKVLRRANCSVVLATQSLSDAKNSGLLDVIKESCPTKIFLPNVNAKDPSTAEIYQQAFGLNERQIEMIAAAVPKQHYYLVSPSGNRMFSLALGQLALAFVGVSDRKTVKDIQECIERHKERWVDNWLADRGLKLSDYVYVGENA